MEFKDAMKMHDSEPKTWGQYFKTYIGNTFIAGVCFGIGHFTAYVILKSEYFRKLKELKGISEVRDMVKNLVMRKK